MTLDEKYIEKLSPSLPNFRKVKDGVYRFDCVFCENWSGPQVKDSISYEL